MRTLCLNFPQCPDSDFVEKFTCFSPLVICREPGLIFIEISSTAHIFGGEKYVLQKSFRLAQQYSRKLSAAIADQPYSAQALAQQLSPSTTLHHLDSDSLGPLSLDCISSLEGVLPWASQRQVDVMIQALRRMGFSKVQDLLSLSIHQWRARWGTLGVVVWSRIHQREEQPIAPLPLQHPLYLYIHMDFGVSDRKLLMHKLRPALSELFSRAESMGRFAQKLHAILHCEFSDVKHHLWVEPVGPSRDLNLFADLLEKHVEKLDTQNPVTDVELKLFDVPEKVYQMDFFEPVDPTGDQWRRLVSFCRQMGVEMGFLQPHVSHFPEESFSLSTKWPELHSPKDKVERLGGAIQVKSVYSKGLSKSPRPSLLLKEPRPLSRTELKRMRFLSGVPSERIEADWWEAWTKKKAKPAPARDYYFAISQKGQWLWLYQEHQSKEFFLHGYFD